LVSDAAWWTLKSEEFRRQAFWDACQAAREELVNTDQWGNPAALLIRPIGLYEPGKIRVITLGSGSLYSALGPVQGALLECWKNHPASTMKYSDLCGRVNRILRKTACLGAEWLWESGDYKSATDLLKRQATRIALDALDGMDGQYLALLSVEPGTGEYEIEDDGKKTVERTTLKEGQLMGHPLSFPLLCVINLAVYLRTVDQYVDVDRAKRMRLREALLEGVIVNGDDIVFRSDAEFSQLFWANATDVGFKMSVGKSYRSPNCCMINSQIFKLAEVKGTNRRVMVRQGYLNQRIVTGNQVKTGQDSDLQTPDAIGAELNRMFKHCAWARSVIPTTLSRFGHYWHGKGAFQPNWYIPAVLGGFGVDPAYSDKPVEYTRAQRVLAARFSQDASLNLFHRKVENPGDAPDGGVWKSRPKGLEMEWRIVPSGVHVAQHGESFDDGDDGWALRLPLLNRYRNLGRVEHPPTVGLRARRYKLRSQEHSRFQPMTDGRIEAYRTFRKVGWIRSGCPPLGVLRYPPMCLDA